MSPFQELFEDFRKVMRKVSVATYDQLVSEHTEAGIPTDVAERLAAFSALRNGLDIIDIALAEKRSPALVAEVYYTLSDLLDISWIQNQIRDLQNDTVWHDRSRFSLGNSLRGLQSALTSSVLETTSSPSSVKLVENWASQRDSVLKSTREMVDSLRQEPHTDASMISVLVGEMDRLI